ncbi:MAG: MFS transporter [Nitrospira sp.]|nr:MFS transporter [Nitrospira sp.]
MSTVRRLVRPSELVTANALIQGMNNIGLLLGPAISCVLIAMMGAENGLYVNSATFFVSALCLIPMRFHETLKTAEEAGNLSSSVLDDLKVGFRFVFGTQSTVFLLVIISALYNLGASAFVFILPMYAKEFLQVGPAQSLIGLGLVLLLTAAVAIRFMRQAVMAQRVAA